MQIVFKRDSESDSASGDWVSAATTTEQSTTITGGDLFVALLASFMNEVQAGGSGSFTA